jgi:hypothetical protein
VGNPRACYEPVPGPMLDHLERGSPETKPRSCGTQPAHESLFNRRLRVLSPAVRTTIGAVRSGGVKNCALLLESEHESRQLTVQPRKLTDRLHPRAAVPAVMRVFSLALGHLSRIA